MCIGVSRVFVYTAKPLELLCFVLASTGAHLEVIVVGYLPSAHDLLFITQEVLREYSRGPLSQS